MPVHLPTCTARELYDKLRNGDDFVLLDVRTDEELALARLDPCLHIPMHQIEDRIAELDHHREREIIVLCHHGIRSGMVTAFLLREGFRRARNLGGGIERYSVEADPSIPTY